MPSAVSRLRSQVAQKGVVVDAMMPNVVPSGSTNRCAGAELSSKTCSIGPYCWLSIFRMAALERTLFIDQSVAVQAGVEERLSLLRQQDAVGRQGEVFDPGIAPQHADQDR